MTLNGAYSWAGATIIQGRRAYAHAPTSPAFLLEEPYDEEGPDGNDFQPERDTTRAALPMVGMAVHDRRLHERQRLHLAVHPGVWQQHLNTQGARDMANLNAFIRSSPGSSSCRTASDRRPGDGRPRVCDDLGRARWSRPPRIRPARCWSPTCHRPHGQLHHRHDQHVRPDDGALVQSNDAARTPPSDLRRTRDTQTFTVPGDNGTGSTDWTLVLTVP